MPDLNRITQDPQVMGGKPCVRGLRVTVGTKEYPSLERDDIQAALSYAAWRVKGTTSCSPMTSISEFC